MNTKKSYIYAGLITVVVLISVIILANEIPKFHLLLHPRDFLIYSALASIAVGAFIAYLVSRKMSFVDRLRAYLCLIIFGFIPVMGLGAWMNRQGQECHKEQLELVNYEERFGSAFGAINSENLEPNQFIVTFKRNDRLYRKMSEREFGFHRDSIPAKIELHICSGLLGFDFIQF